MTQVLSQPTAAIATKLPAWKIQSKAKDVQGGRAMLVFSRHPSPARPSLAIAFPQSAGDVAEFFDGAAVTKIVNARSEVASLEADLAESERMIADAETGYASYVAEGDEDAIAESRESLQFYKATRGEAQERLAAARRMLADAYQAGLVSLKAAEHESRQRVYAVASERVQAAFAGLEIAIEAALNELHDAVELQRSAARMTWPPAEKVLGPEPQSRPALVPQTT